MNKLVLDVDIIGLLYNSEATDRLNNFLKFSKKFQKFFQKIFCKNLLKVFLEILQYFKNFWKIVEVIFCKLPSELVYPFIQSIWCTAMFLCAFRNFEIYLSDSSNTFFLKYPLLPVVLHHL